MNNELAELIANAKAVSLGMIKVAATKPNEHPLQSNAETFRGAANMLNALSHEVARYDQRTCDLVAKLQRIANLQVRGAAEAISDGDWKSVVEELQAVAEEALTPGLSLKPRSGGSRTVPRRPAA